jgi:hypothetical protein
MTTTVSKEIEQQMAKRYVKKFLWSVVLYGSQVWAIGEIDQRNKRPSKPSAEGGC